MELRSIMLEGLHPAQIKEAITRETFSEQECRKVWRETAMLRGQILMTCYKICEELVEDFPENERVNVAPNSRDYDKFCLTVFSPQQDEGGLNQAIQIQIDKKKNALCIAEGKIDIHTPRMKDAANQDIMGTTHTSMGVVLVTKIPESSEENVAVYPYFKAKKEISLTPKRINDPTGLTSDEIPGQIKTLFEQAKKYLEEDGLLAFNAKMYEEPKGLNGGTREVNLLTALQSLVDTLNPPAKPEFQPAPQQSF